MKCCEVLLFVLCGTFHTWEISDACSHPSLPNELPESSLFSFHSAPREAVSPSLQLFVRLCSGFWHRQVAFLSAAAQQDLTSPSSNEPTWAGPSVPASGSTMICAQPLHAARQDASLPLPPRPTLPPLLILSWAPCLQPCGSPKSIPSLQ